MTCLGGNNLAKLYLANNNEIKSLLKQNKVPSVTLKLL